MDLLLYVILDMYSRYVVGWMLAYRETAALAERLIRETCECQGIRRDQLTIRADREKGIGFDAPGSEETRDPGAPGREGR